MAKFDEIPRGQLSTIILTCLTEKDKYGYEIIDDVLNKTDGKMSIKQPSLYSSLKRMEEQSLISSYWRDSEIGGKRHYYHLTDLGKKHLEKWQTNINFANPEPKTEETVGDHINIETNFTETKVLQQDNFLVSTTNSTASSTKSDIETTNNIPDGQLNLFTSTTIKPVKKKEYESTDEFLGLPSAINAPEKQNPIVTEYEKPEKIEQIKKFDYIKKSNRSFSEKIKTIKTVEEKRFSIVDSATTEIQCSNTTNNSLEGEVNNENINENNLQSIANDISYKEIDHNETLSIVDTSITNIKINAESNNCLPKIDKNKLEGYVGNKKNENSQASLKQYSDAVLLSPHEKIEPINTVTTQNIENAENTKKDDGVLITDRLDIKDIPKQPRYETRHFEIYISDNSLTPKFKSNKDENYEERVKDLYEKSKTNAENQKLEIIDSKIRFSSYKDLESFYAEQNIKFKPYKKTLYKSTKDFDMIRITKLNMLTSLLVFFTFSILSTIMAIAFNFVKSAKFNCPLTFAIIPILMFCTFIIRVFIFERSPQKRIAYDINKFKFNYKLLLLSILILPIIFAVNLLLGFNFTNFIEYSVTLIYPCLLSLVYITYYLTQKILIKSKFLY